MHAPSDKNAAPAPDSAPALAHFSSAVRAWFERAFPQGPTPVQARAWDAVAEGDNVLVIAPTGSGKTLAAFLHSINRLIDEREARLQHPKRNATTRTLYISPMKALGADVERNLAIPLEGIAHAMGARDGEAPVRVGMRTGDTTPEERRRLVRNPPDILITTPESLYLMLTSKAREILRGIDTVIVDEVHAIAGNKRGAHLALSLERLDDLLEKPAQRIGLSATVQPPDEVARFLGGIHDVRIVRDERTPALDVEVRVPVRDMTAIQPTGATGAPSIWPYIEASILDEVEAHASTIVFVNSRGLCEKLTARLNELYVKRHGIPGFGSAEDIPLAHSAVAQRTPDGFAAIRSDLGGTTTLDKGAPALIAKAHHGSVSKDRRHLIEAELKRGDLKCVVATSSLELGIDMGDVDLVLQVAPPLSVSSGLQRIGRANHQVGGRSHGIIYPRVRTEVLDAAVATEGMRSGALERTVLAKNALDVLAQQTIAAAAMRPDGLEVDAWYATVRRAANYAELTRDAFDSVVAMLAGAYNFAELAEFAPRVTFDAERGVIIPRPNAQRLAVTAAGTIPDRGMFPVMLPQADGNGGRRRVGELDEEMVMESRVGDVITLGTSTWRITEIERDRVLVVPAEGRASRLPFWHGDSVGRSFDAGCAKGAFVRAAVAALDATYAPEKEDEGAHTDERDGDPIDTFTPRISPDFEERLMRDGLDDNAQRNLVELVALQRHATGSVPTDRVLVAEQCADETGDWRLILHSPFGRRVHLPWALAISARVRETLGFDPEAMAGDDGIMLRIPLTEASMPDASAFRFSPDEIDDLVRRNIESTSLFASRFRECAARALTITPPAPGKRAPLWQQRMKGGQLLEAARNNPGFPLLAEAARECLTEAYDIDSLKQVMRWLETGDIRIAEAHTASPSPFAAPLMFGYVAEHLYEGDLPHAERNASLLAVDPTLLGELLGQADPSTLVSDEALADVESMLQRTEPSRHASSIEGVFDLLRELGPLTMQEVAKRTDGDTGAFLAALEQQHRAFPVTLNEIERWAASTDARSLHEATGATVPAWALQAQDALAPHDAPASADTLSTCRPLDELIARFALTNVPFSAKRVATHLGTGQAPVSESLERLENAGRIARFGATGLWCAPAVLRRLRARSQALAEAAAAPVSPFAYMRFLLQHQGVAHPESGIDALARTIEMFEGTYLPWDAWESAVFPARVGDYAPAMLDELIGSGEVIWCCRAHASDDHKAKTGTTKPAVAFFPTDSPLAPVIVSADMEAEEEVAPAFDVSRTDADDLLATVSRTLSALGPMDFAALAHTVRADDNADATNIDIVRALRMLALNGSATCDSFQYVRTGQLAASASTDERKQPDAQPLRRTSSRRGLRSQMNTNARRAHREQSVALRAFENAIAGRWMSLASTFESDTSRALGLVEGLLDCYGIATRDIALHAGVPGALTGIYPVLKAMEGSGDLLRGAFVRDMGPAQFCERETLERIRAIAKQSDSGNASSDPTKSATADSGQLVVLAADDPAWLYGDGVPWPAVAFEAAGDSPALDVARLTVRPRRAPDSLLVIHNGTPALLATAKLKHLIAFTADDALLHRSVHAVIAHTERTLKRQGSQGARTKIQVETLNAVPVNDTPLATALQDLGLIWTPEGMRLYVNPF